MGDGGAGPSLNISPLHLSSPSFLIFFRPTLLPPPPFRFRPLPLSSSSAPQSGTDGGRRPSPAAYPSTLPFCFIILQTHVLFSIFPYGPLRSPSSLWLSGDPRRSLRVDNPWVSSYLRFLVWLLGSSSFTMFLTLFHFYFWLPSLFHLVLRRAQRLTATASFMEACKLGFTYRSRCR